MGWDHRGRRTVDETTLLAWWRDRMTADPVHQQRLKTTKLENRS